MSTQHALDLLNPPFFGTPAIVKKSASGVRLNLHQSPLNQCGEIA